MTTTGLGFTTATKTAPIRKADASVLNAEETWKFAETVRTARSFMAVQTILHVHIQGMSGAAERAMHIQEYPISAAPNVAARSNFFATAKMGRDSMDARIIRIADIRRTPDLAILAFACVFASAFYSLMKMRILLINRS